MLKVLRNDQQDWGQAGIRLFAIQTHTGIPSLTLLSDPDTDAILILSIMFISLC